MEIRSDHTGLCSMMAGDIYLRGTNNWEGQVLLALVSMKTNLVLMCGIQTLAIFTIQIRCLCATAVTTVPVTATIVVGVVTVAVSLPLPDLAPPITVS